MKFWLKHPIVVLFIISLAIRLPWLALPPRDGVYDGDELNLVLTVLDHWLGLPSTVLQWPGTPLQILGALLIYPILMWRVIGDASLGHLLQTLVSWYEHPAPLIILFRFISSVSAAATAALLYLLVQRITGKALVSIIAALTFTVAPLTFRSSLTATTDMMPIMFCTAAAYVLVAWERKIVLAGALIAAAIATKVIALFTILPFLAYWIVRLLQQQITLKEKALKIIALAVASAAFGLLLIPWAWLEPLHFLKSIVGEYFGKIGVGVPRMEMGYFGSVPGSVVLIGLAIVVLAALLGIWKTQRMQSAPLLAAGALTLLAIAYFDLKGVPYWRYLVGLQIPVLVILSVPFAAWNNEAKVAAATIVIVGLSIVAFGSEVYVRSSAGVRDYFAAAATECRDGRSIWIQDILLKHRYDRQPLPAKTIGEVVGFLESPQRMAALDSKLKWAHVNRDAASQLRMAFDADDRVALGRWKLLELGADTNAKCDMRLYSVIRSNATSRGPDRDYLSANTLEDVKKSLAPGMIVIGESGPVDSLHIKCTHDSYDDEFAIARVGQTCGAKI